MITVVPLTKIKMSSMYNGTLTPGTVSLIFLITTEVSIANKIGESGQPYLTLD